MDTTIWNLVIQITRRITESAGVKPGKVKAGPFVTAQLAGVLHIQARADVSCMVVVLDPVRIIQTGGVGSMRTNSEAASGNNTKTWEHQLRIPWI